VTWGERTRRWSGRSGAREDGPDATHGLQVHRDGGDLEVTVAEYLREGWSGGAAVVAFAGVEVHATLLERLRDGGLDAAGALRSGTLRLEDADAHLARMLSDAGMPHPDRFRDSVGAVVEAVLGEAEGRPVRVYCGMADRLRGRNPEAAFALEDLWGAFARVRPRLSILCGYAVSGLDRTEPPEGPGGLAHQQGREVPGPVHSLSVRDEAVSAELSRLRRRTEALEAEVRRREALEARLRSALDHRRRSEEEARRTQEELRAAKAEAERASRAKSRFLAVVSHEIRTPLTAIMGYQDLLDMELKGPINPEQRVFVRNIGTATEQALGIMEQLLGLARIEAGEEEIHAEPLDPAALVEEVLALVEPEARERGLDLELRCGDLPPSVRSDATKLRQILLNLLGNAVKFTAEGRVELAVGVEEGVIRFDVSDTGPGIEEGQRERIFEHFTRIGAPRSGRRGGLGLGLALSRDLAALLGGAVSVESVPGEGSTFTLRVPLEAPAPSGAPRSS
jgi:signal transduction histidine kinase